MNAIQALSQLSYGPRTHDLEVDILTAPAEFICQSTRAGLTRLELATSGVTDRHSNRLSYSPNFPSFLKHLFTCSYPDGESNPDYQVENLAS